MIMKKTLYFLLLINIFTLSGQNCWEKSYDFTYNSFTKTLNNKYFFAGSRYGDMNTISKLMQAGSDGTIQWDSTYIHGYSGQLSCESIVATPDSGVLIGCVDGGINFLKFDKHNKLTTKTIIVNSFYLDIAGAITPTRDGNFLAVLGSRILKLSPQGDSIWMKDTGYPIVTGLMKIDSEENGYYCMAIKYIDMYTGYINELLKINEDGDVVFSKDMDEYCSASHPTSFVATKDGSLMIVYDRNMIFTKMDITGNKIWERNYNDIGPNPKCMAVTPVQDGGFMTANIVNYISGAPSIWLMKLNANGDSIYSIKENTAIMNPIKIIEDTTDNTFVFNASRLVYDSSKLFKFNSICHVITSINKLKSSQTNIFCYPEPVVNELTISLENYQNKKGHAFIYNCNGKLVLDQEITIGIDPIKTNELPRGIYFLRLIVGNEAFSCKVIKE